MSNWEQTQHVLQNPAAPIIKKPALTDKYLSKPPFRFLHDVITAVQKETGFAAGLYNDAELDAKAIQDKESKVAYLSKIMDVVGVVLNEAVPAKPLKVVAGLEPEATNVFLQMLGKACRMDSTKAVQKVLGGGAAASAPEPSRPSSRPSSQHPKGEEEAGHEPSKSSSSKEKVRSSKEGDAKAKSSSSSSKSKEKEKKPEKEPEPEKPPEKEKEKEKDKEKSSSSKEKSSSSSKEKSSSSSKSKPKEEGASESTTVRDPSPSEGAAKFNRPQSARKAPPKLPAANAPPPAPPAARPARKGASGAAPPERPGTSSGRPGAAPVHVYEESAGKADEDDDVEVVTEQAPPAFSRSVTNGGEQGALVKNIIEAERSLKKAGEEAAAPADEEANGTGIILGRRRGAGAGGTGPKTDATAVRELVQKLVQSSHPLAKSMDYLQEDLDNMAKEYRFWVTERRVYQDKLVEEQRFVNDTSRMASQLSDQDSQIRQAKDRILGLKAQVLRNEETVAKLLGMATGGR